MMFFTIITCYLTMFWKRLCYSILRIALVSNRDPNSLLPLQIYRYFLVSNAIACSYAATSLVYSLAVSSSFNQDAEVLVLSILDLVIMALLFSANGAAAAIGIIGRDGNSHVQWRKVCDMFGGFCHHFTAALVLSLIGSSAFLLLVAFAVLGLHKKAKWKIGSSVN